MEFQHAVLDNGLTVVGEVNRSVTSMALGFFVRTGSRDETAKVSGVSHFLEHMMFKGTARRTAFDVNRDFDRMGAQYNAFTSEENTVYYGAVLREFQTDLLDLLGDILRPALRQEDFDLEKNVILDEIARYEDQPRFRIYVKLMGEYFSGHPLGNAVLGTTESITALTRQDMLEYFHRCYSPGNITVVVVGNLDWPAAVEKVAQVCSSWQPYEVARVLPSAPAHGTARNIVDLKLTRQHVGLMSPAPSGQDPQRYAAHLAATILGDESGSRLFYALIEPAIADEVNANYEPLDGTGAFLTMLSCDPGRASEAVRIARAEFRRFLDDRPSEAELLAAKNKIASAATLKGELPMGRLTSVGFDWVYRKEHVALAKELDAYFAVTADQVLEVARRYDLMAMTVLGLGPQEVV
ncbi:MAG: insulinase family protein [Phycisphaerae bacterium]|nr:insulinase family protein [Phycisphaerae bacterium]